MNIFEILKIHFLNKNFHFLFKKIFKSFFLKPFFILDCFFSKIFQKKNENVKNVKHILFITTLGMGDVICLLPTLKALRENFLDAKIIIVTSQIGKEILELENVCDKIFIKKIKLKILKSFKFDLFIDLSGSFTNSLRAFYSNAKIKICFSYKIGKIFYNQIIQDDIKKHEAFNRLDILDALDIKHEKKFPHINISKKIKILENFSEKDILIGFHPFGKFSKQDFSIEKFLKIANYLTEKNKNIKIVITGSFEDFFKIKNFIKFFDQKPIILAGKTSILDLVAILKMVKLFITIDTGPMHLAYALNINTIAIFGPSTTFRWGYNRHNFIAIEKKCFCRPCSIDLKNCRSKRCMKNISEKDVIFQIYHHFIEKNNILSNWLSN